MLVFFNFRIDFVYYPIHVGWEVMFFLLVMDVDSFYVKAAVLY